MEIIFKNSITSPSNDIGSRTGGGKVNYFSFLKSFLTELEDTYNSEIKTKYINDVHRFLKNFQSNRRTKDNMYFKRYLSSYKILKNDITRINTEYFHQEEIENIFNDVFLALNAFNPIELSMEVTFDNSLYFKAFIGDVNIYVDVYLDDEIPLLLSSIYQNKSCILLFEDNFKNTFEKLNVEFNRLFTTKEQKDVTFYNTYSHRVNALSGSSATPTAF